MPRWEIRLFALLALLGTIGSVLSVQRQPIWSPLDELAHYDYIERVSRGALPRIRRR